MKTDDDDGSEDDNLGVYRLLGWWTIMKNWLFRGSH